MPFPFYTGQAEKPLEQIPEELTLARREKLLDPSRYKASAELVDAVNVALLLGQPLLLTGEPGTGKTQLAYSISWELGFQNSSPLQKSSPHQNSSPLIFETKSTSTARDLFYTYDTIGRFHAAQTRRGVQDSRAYITYNALGIAILRANREKDVEQYLPLKVPQGVAPLADAGESSSEPGESLNVLSEPPLEKDFVHGGQRRSVVLIDEIDKAPRDFPNDILNEVENMYFRVPELGNMVIGAEEKWRPVLILTSNSEKNLPDAFLRRCVYFHIEPPDKKQLREIVESRIGRFKDNDMRWLDEALDLFDKLRAPNRLVKKPATAELLSWLAAVEKICKVENITQNTEKLLHHHPKLIERTLGVLVKTKEDVGTAKSIVEEWRRK